MYKILGLGKMINNYYKQHTFAIKTIVGSTILCSTLYSTKLYINYDTQKKLEYNTQQQIYNLVQDICYKNVSISALDTIQTNKYINKIYNTSTLLNIACKNNNLKLIKYLVEHGADVNMHDEIGYISLHSVLLNDNPDINIIKYLVEHGADVNAVSYLDVNFHKNQIKNNTVLHYACNNNDLDIVMYLIDKGAKINEPNADGRHPIDLAVSRKYNNIVQYMKSKGAYETAIKVDSFLPSYQRYPTFF